MLYSFYTESKLACKNILILDIYTSKEEEETVRSTMIIHEFSIKSDY